MFKKFLFMLVSILSVSFSSYSMECMKPIGIVHNIDAIIKISGDCNLNNLKSEIINLVIEYPELRQQVEEYLNRAKANIQSERDPITKYAKCKESLSFLLDVIIVRALIKDKINIANSDLYVMIIEKMIAKLYFDGESHFNTFISLLKLNKKSIAYVKSIFIKDHNLQDLFDYAQDKKKNRIGTELELLQDDYNQDETEQELKLEENYTQKIKTALEKTLEKLILESRFVEAAGVIEHYYPRIIEFGLHNKNFEYNDFANDFNLATCLIIASAKYGYARYNVWLQKMLNENSLSQETFQAIVDFASKFHKFFSIYQSQDQSKHNSILNTLKKIILNSRVALKVRNNSSNTADNISDDEDEYYEYCPRGYKNNYNCTWL